MLVFRVTASRRQKNETETKKVEEMVEVPALVPRRPQLCAISKKYVGAHVFIQGMFRKEVL